MRCIEEFEEALKKVDEIKKDIPKLVAGEVFVRSFAAQYGLGIRQTRRVKWAWILLRKYVISDESKRLVLAEALLSRSYL